MNPDEVFADRVRALVDFKEAWTEYFKRFVKAMTEHPEETVAGMKAWIRDREAI